MLLPQTKEVPLTCPLGRQDSPVTQGAALESDCLGSSPAFPLTNGMNMGKLSHLSVPLFLPQ